MIQLRMRILLTVEDDSEEHVSEITQRLLVQLAQEIIKAAERVRPEPEE